MILAHISDPHVRVGDAVAADRLRVVSAYLDSLTGIDAVVVTGDVTSDGLEEELALFHELAPKQHPVVVLPGNHDARGPAADAPEMRPQVLRLGQVRLRTLDTTIRGYDDGWLRDEVLAELDADLSADESPTLLALHHPPAALFMAADRWPLGNRHLLDRLLTRHPHVLGVLAGHAHHAAVTTCGGAPLVVCPSVKNAALLPVEGEGLRRGDDPVVGLHEVRQGRLVTHWRSVHHRG